MALQAVEASKAARAPRRFIGHQVPESILQDVDLKAAMSVLPVNYNLELPKTIWRVKQAGAKKVALQFPEGLLMYSLTICDILEAFAGVEECFVLGDVTYGACCVDDFSAVALGAQFLVHYGHSCLVPVDVAKIPCLYVFVDIQIDVAHLVAAVKQNFKPDSRISLAGTIQFSTAIHAAKAALAADFPHLIVPQAKPLSPGEILGCTAPSMPVGSVDELVFVSDGRFHLEAFMIANPTVKAFRYDPYSRVLSFEEYDQIGMRDARRKAIELARKGKQWGIVLGTLGRQGNPRILEHLKQRLDACERPYVTFLISELSPAKIALFGDSIDVWVQIACPRLSIDWGEAFVRPLLTPYEAEVALGFVEPWWIQKRRLKSDLACGGCDDNVSCGVNPASLKGRRQSSGESECTRDSSVSEPAETKQVYDAFVAVEVPVGDYPMDYYARDGGPWNSIYGQKGPLTVGRKVADQRHSKEVGPILATC